MITRPSFVMLATVASFVDVEPKTAASARTHLRALLPDRDVLATLARERLAVPVAPALAQRHPGQLRHQVELRRPHVAERQRQQLPAAVDEREVVRDEAL